MSRLPTSTVVDRLRALGARVGTQPHHWPTRPSGPEYAYVVTLPNGTRRAVSGFDTDRIIERLTAIANGLAGSQGTTSFSPGRSYLVGMPVSVNVHDDGTVTLTVHAEDIVECVADYDDGDQPFDRAAYALQVNDAARAGKALDATGTTSFEIHLTPKGA